MTNDENLEVEGIRIGTIKNKITVNAMVKVSTICFVTVKGDVDEENYVVP